MENKIIEILDKNLNIKKIIKSFQEEFKDSYEKLDKKQKNIVLLSRDAIFRNWFYGSLSDESYLTPNYLINSILQDIKSGQYNVITHIKPVMKNEVLDYDLNYIYYSMKKHPVVDDIIKLLDFAENAIIIKDENMYLIQDGEDIVDELSFRSSYYIEYLVNVAKNLGLIKEMKAIGCRCLNIVQDRYKSFKTESVEENLIKILDASIEISMRAINDSGIFNNKIKRKDIIDLLNNNIYNDSYYGFNPSNMARNIMNDINMASELVETEEIDEDESKELMEHFITNKEEVVSSMVAMYMDTVIDMNFTCVFAYYLGIISPAIQNAYILEQQIFALSNVGSSEQRLSIIFNMDDFHDLTPFGEVIMENYIKKEDFNSKVYKKISEDIIEKQLKEIKREKEQIKQERDEFNLDYLFDDLKNYKEQYVDGEIDIVPYEDEYEDEEDCVIWEFVSEHMEEFRKYLMEELGLKETTVDKHESNVEFFLQMYLRCKDIDKIKNLTSNIIDIYMTEEYIEMATSKTDIKNQLIAFDKYAVFLEKKGYISKEHMERIRQLNKNKDEYIKKYQDMLRDNYF